MKKTFIVSWDVCFAVVVCNSNDELIDKLKEHDDNFVLENDVIRYDWGDYVQDCGIEDVSEKDGIVFDGAFG